MNSTTFIILLLSFIIFIYIKDNLTSSMIAIYKNPIFKMIFLFALYYYGNINIYFTIVLAIYYIFIGQKIQEKELLYNI